MQHCCIWDRYGKLGDGRAPGGGCGVEDISGWGGEGFLSGSIWTDKVEVMGSFVFGKAGL